MFWQFLHLSANSKWPLSCWLGGFLCLLWFYCPSTNHLNYHLINSDLITNHKRLSPISSGWQVMWRHTISFDQDHDRPIRIKRFTTAPDFIWPPWSYHNIPSLDDPNTIVVRHTSPSALHPLNNQSKDSR
jgi:hypothetical protein